VYTTCESLKQIIKLLGPAAVEHRLTEITNALTLIFLKTTVCQTLYDDSSEEEGIYDGDAGEQDNVVLFSNACEVVVQLAKALKERFMGNFELIELLSEYVKPTVETLLRQEAIGTIAEITQNMGPAIAPKLDYMMNLVLTVMKDQHPPTQSNATFCCGLLCEYCGAAATKYYIEIFKLLPPLLQHDKYLELPDNACGLIGRIITTSSTLTSLPLDQLLPALLSHLPLKKDFEENKTVYGAIFTLFQMQNPAISPFIPKLVDLFSSLLGNPTVQDEIKVEMSKMIRAIQIRFPQQFESLVRALSHEQQQNITKNL